jgi:DoxX-like family
MSRGSLWSGRIISALPVLALLFGAVGKLRAPPDMVQIFTGHFGYPAQTLTTIGMLELACAVLYAIPQTSVLGAVLMTGYLGGAVATHVRISETDWVFGATVGVLAWLGLYLRDPRLRELLPLRRLPRSGGANP